MAKYIRPWLWVYTELSMINGKINPLNKLLLATLCIKYQLLSIVYLFSISGIYDEIIFLLYVLRVKCNI